MKIKKRLIRYIGIMACSMITVMALGACGKSKGSMPVDASLPETLPVVTTEAETVPAITKLQPDGFELPVLEGVPIPETEPAPEYLRIGSDHANVEALQARLMKLGFMDNDEPTTYYGTMTEAAVKSFQRQNELAQDGIVGSSTWDSIMSDSAKYYAVAKGVEGEDIRRIQSRIYELGYLPTADMVTGKFGDVTEAAVMKLQEVNGLDADGKVGHQTLNLLYSDEVKANFLAYGEKSEVVLASQNRLRELGYMTSVPDGTYGGDTSVAVKQFQARNDLVVDGYLGPSTRIALQSSEAQPNGLTLGEQGETVQKVQQLLNKYGYLASANATGYYGEVTEKAVKSFQSNNGLSADGSVGAMTMAKLTSTDAKKAPPKVEATTAAKKNNSSSAKEKPTTAPPSSSSGGSPSGESAPAGSGASALISVASSKVGRPYVYGAKGPNSFDCSGFIYWCLNQVGVKQSYLTSSGWRSVGKYTKITSFSNLQAGDIIVVSGHVGIVAGGGMVIDASSSNGRVVHRSLSSWWANNFICGWRIFG